MEETRNACAIFMEENFWENGDLEKWGGGGWRWEIEKKSQEYLKCGFPKIGMLK